MQGLIWYFLCGLEFLFFELVVVVFYLWVLTSRFMGCGGFFLVRFEFRLVGCVVNCGVCGLWTCGVLLWWLGVLLSEYWQSRWLFEREKRSKIE